MNIDLEEIVSFKDFFNQIEEEILVKMYLSDPKSIHRMCIMLSLDMQLETEYEEKQKSFS